MPPARYHDIPDRGNPPELGRADSSSAKGAQHHRAGLAADRLLVASVVANLATRFIEHRAVILRLPTPAGTTLGNLEPSTEATPPMVKGAPRGVAISNSPWASAIRDVPAFIGRNAGASLPAQAAEPIKTADERSAPTANPFTPRSSEWRDRDAANRFSEAVVSLVRAQTFGCAVMSTFFRIPTRSTKPPSAGKKSFTKRKETRGSIDYERVNRAALGALPALLRRWLPGGRREGGEYVALNPLRADRRLGSFRINLRTGRWADFATGDCGGDVVSLAAYLGRLTQPEAAERLAKMFGVEARRG
jgi:hypothetical protein